LINADGIANIFAANKTLPIDQSLAGIARLLQGSTAQGPGD
jgi:hypothetical protein